MLIASKRCDFKERHSMNESYNADTLKSQTEARSCAKEECQCVYASVRSPSFGNLVSCAFVAGILGATDSKFVKQ